jgi:alpha-beta hydrolase superfamily lysophospholipase
MGGAVALLLHRKKPDFWDGAVLVAPMCKVYIFVYYVFSPLFSLKLLYFFQK